MKLRLLSLPAALAACMLAAAVHTPTALAGTYTVTADTQTDITGWHFEHTDAFFGCSRTSYPGVCGNADVKRPSPLQILAYGSASGGDDGYWMWSAPATTSIRSGSLSVTYKVTAPDTSVYMKAHLRSESLETSPQLHVVTNASTTDATWAIPAGNEEVAVVLKATGPHTYTDKWKNHIAINSLTATLDDDTAPAASVSGPLADGGWHNETQPVCLTVSATDAGAGVAAAELRDDTGALLASHTVARVSGMQPGATSYSHNLCAVPAQLGDGVHQLTVTVRDAAGESRSVPLQVRVDAHAPVALATVPAGSTTDLRPAVSFSVDPGPSGLGQFEAALDGQPMTVDGTTAGFTPTADLAYGTHTVVWHASDVAGNVRDGFWTFEVVDATPPLLVDAAPADGWSGELRNPEISFGLTDAGTGVDPSSLHVVLDGTDVTAAGQFGDGRFSLIPAAPLGFGSHHVRVTAADRSRNQMPPVEWSFTVADRTPPVLSDVRPDDGSQGSDRTPPISFAFTDGSGSGVDPAAIQVTLDGVDVSRSGVVTGGRFTYTPSSLLGFGAHTVRAIASDRFGNASEPLEWSFVVRDEQPPAVSGRTPSPGVTVPGAAPIGFDVTDAGTGVDASSLQVVVDGSDVTAWGSWAGGHFSYAPGNLGAGVHTIAVTVADRAGNLTGPVMWQFAVADPATLSLRASAGPAAITAGAHATLQFVARSNSTPLAGARVLVSSRPRGAGGYGPEHAVTASSAGVVRMTVQPSHTTTYRLRLGADPEVSATRTLSVRQHVTIVRSASVLRRGAALRISGRVSPRHVGAVVTIQLLTSRGWVAVARPRLGALSTYAATVIPRVAGRYVFRALVPATAQNAGGTSASVTVAVR